MKKGNCVYFIGDGEFVKIGFTSNLERRLKQLQTGHRSQLRILAYAQGATKSTERLLHEVLKVHRASGEWFHRRGEVSWVIAATQHGRPLLTAADIAFAVSVPMKAKQVTEPVKGASCKLEVPKEGACPVPAIFEGTPAEARIKKLDELRRSKTLEQRKLGWVYRELRHLINGKLYTDPDRVA